MGDSIDCLYLGRTDLEQTMGDEQTSQSCTLVRRRVLMLSRAEILTGSNDDDFLLG